VASPTPIATSKDERRLGIEGFDLHARAEHLRLPIASNSDGRIAHARDYNKRFHPDPH